jgi:hypothetical protein
MTPQVRYCTQIMQILCELYCSQFKNTCKESENCIIANIINLLHVYVNLHSYETVLRTNSYRFYAVFELILTLEWCLSGDLVIFNFWVFLLWVVFEWWPCDKVFLSGVEFERWPCDFLFLSVSVWSGVWMVTYDFLFLGVSVWSGVWMVT